MNPEVRFACRSEIGVGGLLLPSSNTGVGCVKQAWAEREVGPRGSGKKVAAASMTTSLRTMSLHVHPTLKQAQWTLSP